MKRMVIFSLCLASLVACNKKDVPVDTGATLPGKWIYVGYTQCGVAGCQTIKDNSADSSLYLGSDMKFTSENGSLQEQGTYQSSSVWGEPVISFTTSTRYPGLYHKYIINKDTLRIDGVSPYGRTDYYKKIQ